MDLPIELETCTLVSSMDELRQCILILLKEEQGSFLQDFNLGSFVKIHTSDLDLIDECVRATVGQIKGLVVKDIQVDSVYNIIIAVEYQG